MLEKPLDLVAQATSCDTKIHEGEAEWRLFPGDIYGKALLDVEQDSDNLKKGYIFVDSARKGRKRRGAGLPKAKTAGRPGRPRKIIKVVQGDSPKVEYSSADGQDMPFAFPQDVGKWHRFANNERLRWRVCGRSTFDAEKFTTYARSEATNSRCDLFLMP